jgi:dCTP deaminase
MNVMSDQWFLRKYQENQIIHPFEKKNEEGIISYGVSSYGYDVRIANEFKIFTDSSCGVVDPKNFDKKNYIDLVEEEENFILIPGHGFALGRTVEYIKVPRETLVICLGKSTYARCGIIVNVTPLEPEWEGHVTIEISNTTPLPAKIYINEGIAQCIFLSCEKDSECLNSYKDQGGKYMGQTGVTLPYIKKDINNDKSDSSNLERTNEYRRRSDGERSQFPRSEGSDGSRRRFGGGGHSSFNKERSRFPRKEGEEGSSERSFNRERTGGYRGRSDGERSQFPRREGSDGSRRRFGGGGHSSFNKERSRFPRKEGEEGSSERSFNRERTGGYRGRSDGERSQFPRREGSDGSRRRFGGGGHSSFNKERSRFPRRDGSDGSKFIQKETENNSKSSDN